MQILFLVSAHNSLSQRAWIALAERGHDLAVAVVDSAAAMEAAVRAHAPDLIVCPFLKSLIPESIWGQRCCLIVHPGPPGDRGPSSLDWAIELDKRDWGVTVLQATGEVDAGHVWATRGFKMRKVGKSSIYRHEVRRAAIEALLEAVENVSRDGASRRDQAPMAFGPCLPLMAINGRSSGQIAAELARTVKAIHAAVYCPRRKLAVAQAPVVSTGHPSAHLPWATLFGS